MRLYKISAAIESKDLSDAVLRIRYVGTQAEAAATRKEFLELGATRKGTESVEVDVPTDKAGLMAFLNQLVNK